MPSPCNPTVPAMRCVPHRGHPMRRDQRVGSSGSMLMTWPEPTNTRTNTHTHTYVRPHTHTHTRTSSPSPGPTHLFSSLFVFIRTRGGGVGRATCPLTHPCVLRLCPHLNVVQGVGLQKCNLQTWPATTVRRLRRDASSMSLSAWTHHSLLKATAPINFAQGRLASGAANREVRDTSQNSMTSTASP